MSNIQDKMIKASVALALTGALLVSAGGSSAETFSGQSTNAGTGSYFGMVAFKTVVSKYTDYDIELQSNVGGPKLTLAMARNKLDFASAIPILHTAMKGGRGAFKKLADAPKLYENIRTILSHPGGTYHVVAFEKSGLKSIADIKGKKVFSGPAKGAAQRSGQLIISATTGYEAGKDYELVNLDWRGGEQAFLDGHVDLYIRPAPLGGAMIEQLGLTRKFTLLGLNEQALKYPDLIKFNKLPGRALDTIQPGVYTGQTNSEPLTTLGFSLGIGVNKGISADKVYAMTKAVWEHLDEFKATAKALFAPVSRDTAFYGLAAPLHAGAYRYYKEAGFNVPENLIPPEAK